jgi:hypothetical protein
MVSFVAAEQALSEKGLVAQVAFESQVGVLGVHLLKTMGLVEVTTHQGDQIHILGICLLWTVF